MNELQKKQIIQYRENGLSYKMISSLTDISVNSVKSFCQRNNLGGVKTPENDISFCKNCGAFIYKTKGKKQKRFCCDKCRNAWWNNNLALVKRKTYHVFTCSCCSKTFISYGSRHRKYCSHECYIKDRFGGPNNEQN